MFFIFVEMWTEEVFSGRMYFILPEVDSVQEGPNLPLERCFSSLQKLLKLGVVLEECSSFFQKLKEA
jgi:hypothetical protein